jgi:hypothetical protein
MVDSVFSRPSSSFAWAWWLGGMIRGSWERKGRRTTSILADAFPFPKGYLALHPLLRYNLGLSATYQLGGIL